MKKRTREISAPDITPLIDVVFLLLIFFMVSTVFKKDEFALTLNLPKTNNTKTLEKGKKESVLIELTSKKLALNGKKMLLKDFSPILSKIKNRKIPVEFRVDKDVKYQKIMDILDLLQKFSLSNISLVSKK